MLSNGFTSEPTPAENAVLAEFSHVLVGHLLHWRKRRDNGEPGATSPVLLQIDGPGRSLLLDKVAARLEASEEGRSWSVIRFDAWQYQRVPPPWWWLIKAIDDQLQERIERDEHHKGLWRWRWRDARWRLKLVGRDLLFALPVLLVAAALAVVAWLFSGASGPVEILQWAVTAAAAVTAVVGLGASVINAIRRHLLVASPAGANAVLQTSDPMAELLRRYRFLIRGAGTDVAILIDNLDRCRADYVVALLEGIQTLFRNEPQDLEDPMVLYIVAADHGWLCDSYLTVYDEFKASMSEPGRPFGQKFLDKVFDFSLRIPTVPAAASLASELATKRGLGDDVKTITSALSEGEVRRRLRAIEDRDAPAGTTIGPPDHQLRLRAVRKLAELEYVQFCQDTETELRELTADAEPGPSIVRHLVAAYCVQRTAMLLGGHAFDADAGAIRRLGLWTILGLRWPLLADQLVLTPSWIERLAEGRAPDGASAEIGAVYALPEARRFGELASSAGLDGAAVTRFTTPIELARQPSSTGRARTFARGRRGSAAPASEPSSDSPAETPMAAATPSAKSAGDA
jgi:hypothetical protein